MSEPGGEDEEFSRQIEQEVEGGGARGIVPRGETPAPTGFPQVGVGVEAWVGAGSPPRSSVLGVSVPIIAVSTRRRRVPAPNYLQSVLPVGRHS